MIPLLAPLTTRLRRRMAAVLAVAVAGVLPLALPAAPSAQADFSASSAAGGGYWMVASDGGIFSFGSAKFFGSTGNIKLNQPIVGIAATPTGNGYWMVATDGGIFSFGDAKFFGSTGSIKLNKPIVGMTSTPTGNGYWMVASDGGIFSFGDTKFFGSTGSIKLNKPITAMAATPKGLGYWLTASDGGIFSYGDAAFFGSAPSRPAKGDRTVTAMVPSPDGAGYWQASTSGEVLAFGSAADLGGVSQLSRPVVGMTAVPGGAGGPTTVTTTPGGPTVTTTPTTLPPGAGVAGFSSTAKVSWGTPPDPNRTFINKQGQTMYPYSQEVDAIAEIGNSVYIGGQFSDLVDTNQKPSGVPYAYLAQLDTTNGAPVSGPFNAVKLDGNVRALYAAPDGHRLYVGGEFSHVNGETHRRIVALDPVSGAIDRAFNPPEPSGYVSSIVQYGSRLYIGGAFNTLGSTAQQGLAALDAASGNLDAGFVPPTRYPGKFETHTGNPVETPAPGDVTPNGVVTSLAVTADGQYLMVGGNFLHFGTDATADPKGAQHGGIIAVNPVTGGLLPWQPVPAPKQKSRPVFALTVWPGDGKTIFAAAGGAGGRLLTWIPGGQTGVLWRGNVDGDGTGVAATATRVYLVGHYDHEVPDPTDPCLTTFVNGGITCPNGTPHRHLAAFDPRGEIVNGKNTGNAITDPSFTAQADTAEGPDAVLIGAHQMYVGGNFSQVASTPVATGGQRVNQPGFAMYPAQ